MASLYPKWYMDSKVAVDYFFADHLYIFDSDEDDFKGEHKPIDKIRALFLEYGDGLAYKDQWGTDAIYHGPTLNGKPHGYGVNFQPFPHA